MLTMQGLEEKRKATADVTSRSANQTYRLINFGLGISHDNSRGEDNAQEAAPEKKKYQRSFAGRGR